MTKKHKDHTTTLDQKRTENHDDEEIGELINKGVARVRETWAEFQRHELHGPYGKQQILESIYSAYRGWKRTDIEPIKRVLAEFHGISVNTSKHVLNLFIRAALPQIKPPTVAIWVAALRCGEAHHVRPDKLRAFLFVKGGLVKAARQFQKPKASSMKPDDSDTFEPALMDEVKARRQRRSIPRPMFPPK